MLSEFEAPGPGERFGSSVEFVGDVDRDAVTDVGIGAVRGSTDGEVTGRVYILSGRTGRMIVAMSGEGQTDGFGQSLAMPGDVDASGQRHYIRVDRISYSDGSHPENTPGSVDLWPTEADGGGRSLTRRVSTDYGNDPDSWIASLASPGR